MTLDEALVRFEQAASAVEQEHPRLRMIVASARQSAGRIAQRYRVDRDGPRADRELATLLLDLAEAAEREAGVQRYFPSEMEGGPPSMETLEAVRASNRGSLGVAEYARGVSAQTLLGAELGNVASQGLEQIIRGAAVRSGNTLINKVTNWLMDVFGGPAFVYEIPQPVGTITVYPLGQGDPAKAAMVLTTAFVVTALAAWGLIRACTCRCPRSAA